VQLGKCRRPHNRLGFAYQVAFVRLFDRFPQQQPLSNELVLKLTCENRFWGCLTVPVSADMRLEEARPSTSPLRRGRGPRFLVP
jgi:hypothetical protein